MAQFLIDFEGLPLGFATFFNILHHYLLFVNNFDHFCSCQHPLDGDVDLSSIVPQSSLQFLLFSFLLNIVVQIELLRVLREHKQQVGPWTVENVLTFCLFWLLEVNPVGFARVFVEA